MNLIYFIINTNIYISLAAVLLTIETQVQLGMKPQWHPYLFIIFFSTLFEYNLHRLVTVITKKEALNDDKHKWVKEHPVQFYLFVTISALGLIIAILLAEMEVLLALAPIALITIFYSIPVFRTKKNIFRLREFPFLKIFLIAFVWSAATILLPVLQSDNNFNKTNIILMLIERFIFVFAITIPFDIRDLKADTKAGLKTIPIFIGHKKSLTIANAALLLFMMICLFHYQMINMNFILPAMFLSGISTIYFINNKKLQQNSYYHYGILDGTMLLQGLLVWISY